jgi:uncharacterized protein YabE (DUF348 family)
MTKIDQFKQKLTQNRKILLPVAIVTILAGLVLLWFGLMRTITVIVDGVPLTVRTPALSVNGVLRAAEVSRDPANRAQPAQGRLIWNTPLVTVQTAREVTLVTEDYELSFQSARAIPGNLLAQAEIPLFPNDQVRVNGARVAGSDPIEQADAFVLQYLPAQPITLELDGINRTIYSAEPTLGAALEAAQIDVSPQDLVSLSLNTPLDGPLLVSINRARTVSVTVDGMTMSGLTAATTVGGALQALDIPLQNLDVSLPVESAPVPEDGQIQVVRVSEEIQIATDEVAYNNTYVEDPGTPLDQTSVVEPGQLGIYASRERVRYADGAEIWRDSDGTWQASEARDGVLGYGTEIVVQTAVVDGITIEYWRKKSVYATYYVPCDAYGNCYDGTAGGYPLQKGIVAVMPWWYSVPEGLAMADLRVYVQGYGEGIIGDVCGGCSGDTPWIDLAFREEDNINWVNGWTTMYFLTPVPDRYIPPIITP